MNKSLLLFGMTTLLAFNFSCKSTQESKVENTDEKPPYTIQVEEIVVPGFPDLHSFTHGIYQDKIVLIGGRTSGLHAFSYTFAHSLSNDSIFVIDTKGWGEPTKWTIKGLHYTQIVLPSDSQGVQSGVVAALQSPQMMKVVDKKVFFSNNAEFYTKNNVLYLYGGLIGGPNKSVNSNPTTAPYLTAINLPDLINLVDSNKALKANSIRQLYDTSFAITGGEIDNLNNKTYLVFGWHYDNTNSIQYYSHQIKSFTITDDGTTLTPSAITSWSDGFPNDTDGNAPDNGVYRRRDGTMSTMINPANDSNLLLYYAGVFKNGATNFTSVVKITSNGANVIDSNSFTMRSNIYTCQVVPVFSKSRKESYATFLGGITNTTFNGNGAGNYPIKLTQATAPIIDTAGKTNNFTFVPFTNRFSTVCMNAKGELSQYMLADSFPNTKVSYKLPDTTISAPANMYNGAESELLWTMDSKYMVNGMINYDSLIANNNSGATVGYIYGGILSVLPNILAESNGNGSHKYSIGSNRLFRVKIVPLPQIK